MAAMVFMMLHFHKLSFNSSLQSNKTFVHYNRSILKPWRLPWNLCASGSVCVHFNFWINWQTFTKLGMNTMPLEAIPVLYFTWYTIITLRIFQILEGKNKLTPQDDTFSVVHSQAVTDDRSHHALQCSYSVMILWTYSSSSSSSSQRGMLIIKETELPNDSALRQPYSR